MRLLPEQLREKGGCSVGLAAPFHFDDSSPEEFPLFRYGICNKFFLSHQELREVNDFFRLKEISQQYLRTVYEVANPNPGPRCRKRPQSLPLPRNATAFYRKRGRGKNSLPSTPALSFEAGKGGVGVREKGNLKKNIFLPPPHARVMRSPPPSPKCNHTFHLPHIFRRYVSMGISFPRKNGGDFSFKLYDAPGQREMSPNPFLLSLSCLRGRGPREGERKE